jgi:hypothetical protein
MPTDRICVISLGISAPAPPGHPAVLFQDFHRGLERIRHDLAAHGFQGDFIAWDNTYPAGSPTIEEAPFAFKPFCFQEAQTRGYNLVLWVDSSIKIKRPIDPLFKLIKEEGYLIFRENHTVGEFCKDDALAPLGITREESFSMMCCWACVVGMDLDNKCSSEFLAQWKTLASDGLTFPGPKWSGIKGWRRTASIDPRVKGHRHDQTAASVVALRLGMDKWKSKLFFKDYFENERSFVRQIEE